MLFSNDEVAKTINVFFEPVWESVRPVPIVRIDFGNGTVLTRTLHGNIGTYVCTAEGQVLDILPGIYEPKTYIDRLHQLSLLDQYLRFGPQDKRRQRLEEYHLIQATALAENQKPVPLVVLVKGGGGFGKAKIEFTIELVLDPSKAPASPAVANDERSLQLDAAEDLASWKALALDTQVNETHRRRQIHEWLAQRGSLRPEQVKKWLYKDVLHADLDDPYLGLGKTLFANYPFAKEDR